MIDASDDGTTLLTMNPELTRWPFELQDSPPSRIS